MAAKKHRVELRAGVSSAQFQVGDTHVELTEDSPSYETTDPNVFASLCQLPFLKPAAGKES